MEAYVKIMGEPDAKNKPELQMNINIKICNLYYSTEIHQF